MAVNETIVTGRKFRKLTDAASKKWQRISFWHKASDCEFNDGKTAEEKLGAIKGITTDLNVTVPGYAADATRVSELNNSLGGLQFLKDAEGNWGYKPSGADSVTPFSGMEPVQWGISFPGMNDASYTHLFTLQIPYGYKKLKYESAIWASVTSIYGVHGIADGVDVKIGNQKTTVDIDIATYTHIRFYLQYAWNYITFYK